MRKALLRRDPVPVGSLQRYSLHFGPSPSRSRSIAPDQSGAPSGRTVSRDAPARSATRVAIQSVQRKGLTGIEVLWTSKFSADPGERLKATFTWALISKVLHQGHVDFLPFLDRLSGFISKKILPLLIHHQAQEFQVLTPGICAHRSTILPRACRQARALL